ncbi:hypothetical protein N8I77_007932 [Diaporthe amygdali]|uniref:Uncharacterized protein n=1 Tax=Phomopsis amygdali TaxID=1214568 RepID=A0AAD9SCS8_PHOAM|nr:hypothetical protein N8I77_007932 [Diaporthe amygdali]
MKGHQPRDDLLDSFDGTGLGLPQRQWLGAGQVLEHAGVELAQLRAQGGVLVQQSEISLKKSVYGVGVHGEIVNWLCRRMYEYGRKPRKGANKMGCGCGQIFTGTPRILPQVGTTVPTDLVMLP